MTQRAKSKVWHTEKPTVVFMIPSERAEYYAEAMRRLTRTVENDLKWEPDTIELVGLIAATVEHGAEGIYFLEENGISTRAITLLVLWGWSAECAGLQDTVSESCGVGAVVLPATGAVLRTVRMPSLGDWWLEPLNQALAAATYAGLVENGKVGSEESEPYTFVSSAHAWN